MKGFVSYILKQENLIKFEITPEISKFLKDYGEILSFTDLRWGIDTTKYINSSKENPRMRRKCIKNLDETFDILNTYLVSILFLVPVTIF